MDRTVVTVGIYKNNHHSEDAASYLKKVYCKLSGSKGATTKCFDVIRYKHSTDLFSFQAELFIM